MALFENYEGRMPQLQPVLDKYGFKNFEEVKAFTNDLLHFDSDFDLVSGRYVVDAKSIMGIFSLDLSKPIELCIHDDEHAEEILKTLKPYIIQ